MSIKHSDAVPDTGERGWHRMTSTDTFIKWQYKDTPYRLVALIDGRGHWKVVFTSWYSTESYTVAGNLGGGKTGQLKAIAKAKGFIDENEYGCPPPGEYGEK